MSSQIDGPLSTSMNELIGMDSQEEKIGSKLENALDTNESKLLKLFAAPQFDDKTKEKNWLKENGFSGFSTIEGARDSLSLKQKRIERALSAFHELLYSAHQIMMELIRKLRVN